MQMDLSIKIYVVEDSQYNAGLDNGSWFELPVSRAVIGDKINLIGQYDGLEILEYEAPFLIDPYTPIEFLNHVAVLFEENKGHPALPYAVELVSKHDVFSNFEDAIEHMSDIVIHSENVADTLRNQKNVFQMADGVFVEVK